MAHEQQRGPLLAAHLPDQRKGLPRVAAVEIAGRFVGQHEPRMIHQGARDGDADVNRWRLRMDNDWTVPVVELSPPGARSTVLLLADAGRAAAGPRVRELLAAGRRVIAVDPFYFGESKIAGQPGLFAILVAAIGERPLGIQAGQVAAVARWLSRERGLGPVEIATEGPRTGLIGLVAAALEPDAISGLVQRDAMASLREVITGDLTVMQRPEQFCFGLLREFDLPQIKALVAPRSVTSL